MDVKVGLKKGVGIKQISGVNHGAGESGICTIPILIYISISGCSNHVSHERISNSSTSSSSSPVERQEASRSERESDSPVIKTSFISEFAR